MFRIEYNQNVENHIKMRIVSGLAHVTWLLKMILQRTFMGYPFTKKNVKQKSWPW